MIQGTVLTTGEPVVKVRVRGPAARVANVEAMIDTGFNDQLALPRWVIEKLVLQFQIGATYYLADGAELATRMYRAEIEWMGTWRSILVTEVEGDPLVGMLLLRGCHLGIDVIKDGTIEIRPLSRA